MAYIAHNINDPLRMGEALSSPEKNLWMKAMKSETDSLHTNKVWDLAEMLKDCKAIGSKWVFKRKYDADGKLEHSKALPVAQGFFQKHGFDYDESFYPIVWFESIQTHYCISCKT